MTWESLPATGQPLRRTDLPGPVSTAVARPTTAARGASRQSGPGAGPGHRARAGWPAAQVTSAVLLLAGCAVGLTWGRARVLVPDDTGLLRVLPVGYWVAVALLLGGFVAAVWGRRLSGALATANVTALVLALYGVGVSTGPYPRGTVPWRHVGVARELAETGVVDPSIDAYFGWPGFFALLASFTDAAGLEDGQALMRWAPVANELLLLVPLLVLFSALTPDPRLRWSAVALFYLTNWIDQDYLAPQAMGFFLYVCLLGLLLTFFRPPDHGPSVGRRDRLLRLIRGAGPEHRLLPAEAGGPGDQAAVLCVVVLVTGAIVTMHQLTPFAVLLALAGLAVARRTPVRGLPLVTGLLIAVWITLSAASYLQGNLDELLAGVGDVAGAAQGNLVDRIQGSDGHLLVVRARLLLSVAVWGVAGLAVLRYHLRGRRDTTAVVLVGSPFLLFGLQSYGGEMLLRIFLFSLPFAALLVVQLLPRPTTDRRRRVAGGLALVGGLLLVPAFVLTHYGNQVIDVRSPGEVSAVRVLYDLAPPGSMLVAGNDNTPWRYAEYGQHRHRILERVLGEEPRGPEAIPDVLFDAFRSAPDGAFLLLTEQHRAYERLLGRAVDYRLADVEQALLQDERFRVVYRNEDAVVLTLAEDTT